MTATTNLVSIEKDGSIESYKGVLFASEGTHPKSGETGVVLQFRYNQETDPTLKFIPNASLKSATDEIAVEDTAMANEFQAIADE
jgi:hypothetical protein